MKPRNLRHRLEKAAKLLVTVQKHAPEAQCDIDPDKGDNGHLMLDLTDAGGDQSTAKALGIDLEGKSYTFTEKKSPWLGQKTFTGRAKDKTTIVMTLPINIDRLTIGDQAPEVPYQFSEK